MIVDAGSPDQLSQALLPVLAIGLVLIAPVGLIMHKVFGLNRWLTLAGGALMLVASATFTGTSLSTMFYRLTLDTATLRLDFAFPTRQTLTLPAATVRYADAVTPDPARDRCHLVLETTAGALYQSLDLPVARCEQARAQLATTLGLQNRPPKKKSRHAPPLPPVPDTTPARPG